MYKQYLVVLTCVSIVLVEFCRAKPVKVLWLWLANVMVVVGNQPSFDVGVYTIRSSIFDLNFIGSISTCIESAYNYGTRIL